MMKNKIVSAIILGMSATMAMPSAAVFAAETIETNVEEDNSTNHEGDSVSNEISNETSEETPDANSDAPQVEMPSVDESSEVPSTNPEDSMGESSTTPETDASPETPESEETDFKERLSKITFATEKFGTYSDKFIELLSSSDLNVNSLTDCEKDFVEKASAIAKSESKEAINAMKYYIALAFEEVYGEESFDAGKTVREQILADSGITADMSAPADIAACDEIYKTAGGITTNPADLFKPEETPNPDVDLEDYVQGITDLEMVVGAEVPAPEFSFDAKYIKSVTIDVSQVNKDVAGDYTIVYTITGVDGTTKTIEKKCSVVDDSNLANLRSEMKAKIDAIDTGILTETQFKEQWADEVNTAKATIDTLTQKEDMEAVIEKVTEKYNSIVEEQHLFVTKQGSIKILKEYFNSFTYESDAQKVMAEDARDEAIDNISNASTVDLVTQALERGKEAIRKIGEQDTETIKALKSSAKSETLKLKNEISDTTSITANVYSTMVSKIDTCNTVKDIDSTLNSAKSAFKNIKSIINGNMSDAKELYKNLKAIASDSDTTATIDQIISIGVPKDIKDAENKVSDACKALSYNVDDFIKYLSGRAGKEITGDTKAKAYAMYIDVTSGNPDEELMNLKNDVKKEVEHSLDQISPTTDALKVEKDKLKSDIFAMIDAAKSKEELQTVSAKANDMLNELAQKVNSQEKIEALKKSSKEYIQNTVNNQSDSELRALIQELADTAIRGIDSAKTEIEVKNYLDTFKADSKTAIETFNKDKTLATAKAEALKKLSTLESKANSAYVTNDMKNIINNARNAINNAANENECSKAYEDAKKSFNDAYIKTMRATYATKMDELLTKDFKFTNNSMLEKAKEEVAKQKTNLENVSNEDAMKSCYELAKKKVEALYNNQNSDGVLTDLTKAKADAISALTNMVNNSIPDANKVEAQNLLKEYVDKINNADTVDEVNKILEEAKATFQKMGGDPNAAVPNPNTSTTLNGGGDKSASEKGNGEVSATNAVKTGDNNFGIILAAGAAIMSALGAAFVALRKFFK